MNSTMGARSGPRPLKAPVSAIGSSSMSIEDTGAKVPGAGGADVLAGWVGALVITSGGAASLAPRGIVIGRVIKITERVGTAGAVLEVRMTARLSVLNFVRVLLYQPIAAE